MKKLFKCEVWKDFFDEQWRIKIVFWRWEVARFKIDSLTNRVEPVKDGNY